jgi:hypothetical protein
VLVTLVGNMFGQTIMTTYRYVVISSIGSPTLNDSFAALHARLDAASELFATYAACTPPQYIAQEAWYQRVSTNRTRKVVFGVNRTGSNPSTAYTANVAAVISRHGDRAQRSDNGRVHVPIGTDSTALINGNVTGQLFAKLIAHGAKIATEYITVDPEATFAPVLYPSEGGGTIVPIVGTVARTQARVMRRRTLGYGI